MNTLPSNWDALIACVARASLLISLQNRARGLDPREYCLEQYYILELAEYYGAVNHIVLKKFLGVTFDRTIYSWLGNFCSSNMLAAHPLTGTTKEAQHYSLTLEGEKLLVRLRRQFIGTVVFPGNTNGHGGESSDVDAVTEALARQDKELKKH